MKKKLMSFCLAVLILSHLCPPALGASGARDDWAIYLYLCGTDLETSVGAATADLMELVNQSLPDGVTVVVQTGGAKKWHNSIVNANYLERYALKGDQLARVWRGEKKSMGDAETLADFLGFCHKYFPRRMRR